MSVREHDFAVVTILINSFGDVTQNAVSGRGLSMKTMVAIKTPARNQVALLQIDTNTGLTVYDMWIQEVFFEGLKFTT